MNNMIYNDMIGNCMKGYNMMNNNINNMMNYNKNINILINNNINPMVGHINMNQYLENVPKSFNIIFREFGPDSEYKEVIHLKVQENEKISDIIQKYRDISFDYDKNLKFIFKFLMIKY